ncbi:MAG: VOC family protein [Chloroflexota bacterium]|nr:VOC family protein [Chloroflexota bacterium]
MHLLQVAQRVTDMDRAVTFYSRLLGAPPVGRFDPPGLAFFSLGPVRLLLDGNAPSCLIYLHVDDVSGDIELLRNEGVEIVTEPHVIFTHDDDRLGPAVTNEWQAFVHDSEGNLIGLVSQIPA